MGDALSLALHVFLPLLLCSKWGCFFPEDSEKSLAFPSCAGQERGFLCEPPRQRDLFPARYRQASIWMSVPVKYV